MSRVLSIDPGKTGALVLWIDDVQSGMWSVPLMVAPNGKKIINIKKLEYIFIESSPDIVVIEKVHAMPGQGVTSMFTFGMGYGILVTLAAVYADDVIFVTPQVWKKHHGLIGTEKSAATKLAKSMDDLVTNSGKADAYLIGRWYLEVGWELT